MEFTYRSKMEAGEGIILNLWQKALGIFGVLLAALTTEVMLLQHSTKFMYVMSLPLVILILLFYHYDIDTRPDGDPVEIILHDWRLVVLACVYVAMMLLLM